MKHPRVLFASGSLLAIIGVGIVAFVYTSQTEVPGQVQQLQAIQPESQKAVTTDTVTIQSYAFSPQTITVKKGKTVIWTNSDVVAHTLIFDGTTALGSGLLNQGASFSLAFDRVGTFTYHSAAYPDVTGTVLVTD